MSPAGTGPTPSFDIDTSGVDLSEATVLVVDDNEQNLELVQAYLESLPCRIVSARDGIEAMAAIDRDKPDLVLLDVMMPRMSGFEVCQKVKSNPATRDTVVVMVTALHEVGDMERAVECGCDDFISKPVNKVELVARTTGLLKLRLVKRKLAEFLAGDARHN
jgi:two-component system alkaline phosphatase synthesis response regulator PhoP